MACPIVAFQTGWGQTEGRVAGSSASADLPAEASRMNSAVLAAVSG